MMLGPSDSPAPRHYSPYGHPVQCDAPPDIVVQVAGRRFQAHRSVLAAHSDYFSRILSDYSMASSLRAGQASAGDHQPELLFLTLSIPSVSSKLFAVLLDFMYSSRLQLDAHSVADVLFGAQLLRMQRAVDACHSHLLQLRLFTYHPLSLYPVPLLRSIHPEPSAMPPPPFHAGIVRPIPTTGAPAYLFQNPPYTRHPFQPWSSVDQAFRQGAKCQPEASELNQLEVPVTEPYNTNRPSRPEPPQPAGQQDGPSPAPSSCTGNSSSPVHDSVPDHPGDVPEDAAEAEKATASVKAVIDIACCDGPVKFQRVLNENCSLVIMMTATTQEGARPSETTAKSCFEAQTGQVESVSYSPSRPGPASLPETNQYHCAHCKHSFKSRCCYMKHRWRHLNPLSLDGPFGRRKRAPQRSRKPLEINVPFYPCKVCGCKFPSYYFVHKHRRMCHQKHRQRQDGDEGSSSEDSSDAEKGSSAESSRGAE